jgi:effector-binding domain-containing protein
VELSEDLDRWAEAGLIDETTAEAIAVFEGGPRRFHVEAGFPVGRAIYGTDEIVGSSLPGGTVAITTHVGSYDGMEATYEALATWLDSRGSVPMGDPWEIYFSEPTDPPGTWRTDIVQPYVKP